MVATQPLVPQNIATNFMGEPIDPGVHHLMTLSFDVNLQNQQNQYESTTGTVNPFVTSTYVVLDMSLHFLRPPRMKLPNSHGSLWVAL